MITPPGAALLFLSLTPFANLVALAAPLLQSFGPRSEPSDPLHACGDLVREATAAFIVDAVNVYDCLITVPFNAAVASQLLTYWNDTLQFHSTLDYLKHPPSGYQQPAADLLKGLNDIRDSINNGGFTNEYQFEAALFNVLNSAHDAHVGQQGGVLAPFTFGSSWGLSSISVDGIQLPKVYLTDDLLLNQTKGADQSWEPSAISRINNVDAFDYLYGFAALNSPGALEPHADWNSLMDSPVLDILGYYPVWSGSANLYPGDTLSYTFENASTLEDKWLAVYNDAGDTGPLETGGDFYNFFVLGLYPSGFTPGANDAETQSIEPSLTSFANITDAFPAQPDILQANLTGTGFITGYFIHDASLAVLSIPTFSADDDAIQAFTDAVQQFIAQSKANGLGKILIDLQHNDGGDALLPYVVFNQFFPSIDPYAGSVMRAHPLANTLGTVITHYWDNLDPTTQEYVVVSSNEWIATSRLNAATDRNFSSWSEFFGPVSDGIQNMTLAQRLNTSNYAFDFSALGAQEPPETLLSPPGDAAYAAEDIIMLSDGRCASSCSLFMEMMHHDAGVKNVVVGGRPSYGPMQTPSGSRAARSYRLSELDADIQAAVNSSEDQTTNLGFYIRDGGISLRAQVRKGDTVPLAMQFEAADCRIFFTPGTFNNFTNLWLYAADAMWTSPQLCVQNSTGYAEPVGPSGPSAKQAPAAAPPAPINFTSTGVPYLNGLDHSISLLVDKGPMPDGLQIKLSGTNPRPRPTLQSGGNPFDPTQLNNPRQSNLQKSRRHQDCRGLRC